MSFFLSPCLLFCSLPIVSLLYLFICRLYASIKIICILILFFYLSVILSVFPTFCCSVILPFHLSTILPIILPICLSISYSTIHDILSIFLLFYTICHSVLLFQCFIYRFLLFNHSICIYRLLSFVTLDPHKFHVYFLAKIIRFSFISEII